MHNQRSGQWRNSRPGTASVSSRSRVSLRGRRPRPGPGNSSQPCRSQRVTVCRCNSPKKRSQRFNRNCSCPRAGGGRSRPVQRRLRPAPAMCGIDQVQDRPGGQLFFWRASRHRGLRRVRPTRRAARSRFLEKQPTVTAPLAFSPPLPMIFVSPLPGRWILWPAR